MATPVDLIQLSECMRLFSNADPRLYEKFIRILDAYVQEVTVAVTETDTSDILVAKGRAQQARKFFRLFTELPKPQPSP